jgi:hypothetical protein
MEHVDLTELVRTALRRLLVAAAGGREGEGYRCAGLRGLQPQGVGRPGEHAKRSGAKGLVNIAYREDGPKSSAAKFLS